MDLWEWITTTIPAGGAVSAVGVSVFVIAILTDKLMTQAQHLRRIADLTANHERELASLRANHEREQASLREHHAREMANMQARLDEMRESREAYKEATQIERSRADKVIDAVPDISGVVGDVLHVMQSLDRALPPEVVHP